MFLLLTDLMLFGVLEAFDHFELLFSVFFDDIISVQFSSSPLP
jgi:hypothetical protein